MPHVSADSAQSELLNHTNHEISRHFLFPPGTQNSRGRISPAIHCACLYRKPVEPHGRNWKLLKQRDIPQSRFGGTAAGSAPGHLLELLQALPVIVHELLELLQDRLIARGEEVLEP